MMTTTHNLAHPWSVEGHTAPNLTRLVAPGLTHLSAR